MSEQQESSSPGRQGCAFCRGADVLSNVLRNRWSEATKGHFRNSRIEFLKGIRSIIDDRIARMAREEPKGTHVILE